MTTKKTTVLGLVGLTLFVLLSRFLFLTSSTCMWDSCSYVEMVEVMLRTGVVQVLERIETSHSLYGQLCATGVWLARTLGGPEDIFWGMKATGIFLTASSVWPFFWLARGLLKSERWGLLAVAVYSVIPVFWWWSGEIMSDAVGTIFLVWAFGLLMRFIEGRSSANLIPACLILGASPLVRYSSGFAFPAFLLLALVGLWKRRQWLPALYALLVPVPLICAVLIEVNIHPDRNVADLFLTTPQNDLAFTRALTAERWISIYIAMTHGFSPVGMVLVGLGLVAAGVRNRLLFVFAVVWIVFLLAPQLLIYCTMLRYWIPFTPVAALLLVSFLRILRELPAGRIFSTAAAVGLISVLIFQALPDLKTLHERKNILEAVSRWYSENTQPGSLIIAGMDYNHAKLFARDRELLYIEPDLREWPWLRKIASDTPTTILRVDRAIEDNRRVHASSLLEARIQGFLMKYYNYENVGYLDGIDLRNGFDPGFDRMGDLMRKQREVHIFRLWPKARWLRSLWSAPPPDVRVNSSGGEVLLEIRVHCPRNAGWVCFGFISENPAVLYESPESFGKDRILDAGFLAFIQTAAPLDAEGRGCYRVKIPCSEGKPPDSVFAAYCIVDRDHRPALISKCVRIDL